MLKDASPSPKEQQVYLKTSFGIPLQYPYPELSLESSLLANSFSNWVPQYSFLKIVDYAMRYQSAVRKGYRAQLW